MELRLFAVITTCVFLYFSSFPAMAWESPFSWQEQETLKRGREIQERNELRDLRQDYDPYARPRWEQEQRREQLEQKEGQKFLAPLQRQLQDHDHH